MLHHSHANIHRSLLLHCVKTMFPIIFIELQETLREWTLGCNVGVSSHFTYSKPNEPKYIRMFRVSSHSYPPSSICMCSLNSAWTRAPIESSPLSDRASTVSHQYTHTHTHTQIFVFHHGVRYVRYLPMHPLVHIEAKRYHWSVQILPGDGFAQLVNRRSGISFPLIRSDDRSM